MSTEESAEKKGRKRRKRHGHYERTYLPEDMSRWTDTSTPGFNHGRNKKVFDDMDAMLRHIHKQQDPTRALDTLRTCYGCAGAMLRADRYMLEKMGLNHLDALFFSLIPDVIRYMNLKAYGDHPTIGRLQEAANYLIANFANMQDEHFYLYCVNHHGRLKARVLMNKGIEDRALFSLNKLMMEILRADPAAIIVAHNHPLGTLRPSQADIMCTEDILNIAAMMGAPLLDHVVIAGKHAVSLRDNGFIPERIWLEQDPDNPILRNWLLPPPPKKEKPPKILTPEEEAIAAQKARQSMLRQRRRKMEAARREYQHRTKQAEKALLVYRRLWAQEAYDPSDISE